MTGFAVCRFDETNGKIESVSSFGEKGRGDQWPDRLRRWQLLSGKVVQHVEGTEHPIFIEGYSFNSKKTRAHSAGELGCYVRLALTQAYAVRICEITPAEVKKFLTGKGNAGKSLMISKATMISGREFDDDNQVDAYAVALIGACALGFMRCANAERLKIAQNIIERCYLTPVGPYRQELVKP